MKSEIFISLKPEFANLIEQKQKNYEFRKYVTKKQVDKFWIYVTQPVGLLKYVAEVGEYIEYPEKISKDGIGNYEFNEGMKKSKYAYPILHLYKLTPQIAIKELKQKFGFTAPQSYVYIDRYPSLMEYIEKNCRLERVF